MTRRNWLLLLLLVSSTLLLAGCKQEPLLEALDERQANEVIAALLHDNIAAQKKHEGKAGFTVRVAAGDLAQAIDIIHRSELPGPARHHVSDDFAGDGMVSTPQSERVRLLSSIEQRLEESLGQFDGVMSSRVHVSYPVEASGLKARTEPAMHLSALLMMDGNVDEAALIQSVKRLLRNSFENVAYDDISVLVTRAGKTRPTAATPHAESIVASWAWAAVALLTVLGAIAAFFVFGGERSQAVSGVRQWWKRRSNPVVANAHDA